MKFMIFGACLFLIQHSHAAFGPLFHTQNLVSARILEVSSTLVLPPVPSEMIGDIALWIGVEAERGDLIQGIIENAPTDPSGNMCPNLGARWCLGAYTLEDAFNTQHPIIARTAPMEPGKAVTVHYKYNMFTDMWDQELIVDGVAISSLSSSKGQHPYNFLVAVECHTARCSTTPAHSWTNTKIVLDSAEPTFSDGLMLNNNANATPMLSPDGGRTWTIDSINMPEWKFGA